MNRYANAAPGREDAGYYILRAGPDRFDMRQERYRRQLMQGNEHPHDLMAAGFTRDQMAEMLIKTFPDADIDTSAMEVPDA